jgi:hypothetical protein
LPTPPLHFKGRAALLLRSDVRCTSVSVRGTVGAAEDIVVEAVMITTSQDSGRYRPGRPPRLGTSRIGLIVALSIAAGLIVAVALVAAPFVPATENALTGMSDRLAGWLRVH